MNTHNTGLAILALLLAVCAMPNTSAAYSCDNITLASTQAQMSAIEPSPAVRSCLDVVGDLVGCYVNADVSSQASQASSSDCGGEGNPVCTEGGPRPCTCAGSTIPECQSSSCSGNPETVGTECYCDDHPSNAECQRQVQCASDPSGPLCTGERVICRDGTSTDWDTDGDGSCNKDDSDDDGDGVPDSCDPTPEATNPVDSTYNWAVWVAQGRPSSC